MLYKNKHITNYIQLNEKNEEYQYVNNIHDKIFRKVLDNKKEAVQIINKVLKKENKIAEKEIEKYRKTKMECKIRFARSTNKMEKI